MERIIEFRGKRKDKNKLFAKNMYLCILFDYLKKLRWEKN
jgi:hypothetical protein